MNMKKKNSWDTLWEWQWFTREAWMEKYWIETERAVKPLLKTLQKLNVEYLLDASCGLGFKTILFAKAGYKVSGSDYSEVAIKYAKKLAKEEKVDIQFFISEFQKLPQNTEEKYDCVYTDYFDELPTYEELLLSAKGIYSVLKENGKFIFCAPSPEINKEDLQNTIEKVYKKRKVIVYPSVKKGQKEVIHIEIPEKKNDGIMEHHIYVIKSGKRIDVEIASIMNSRIKWTFHDFVKVLKEAGFSEIRKAKREKDEIFIIGIK